MADPLLPAAMSPVPPRWNPGTGLFTDGSATVAQAFARLVSNYGTPASTSPAAGAGNAADDPASDILGNPRGALELLFVFADGFESGDTSAWGLVVP